MISQAQMEVLVRFLGQHGIKIRPKNPQFILDELLEQARHSEEAPSYTMSTVAREMQSRIGRGKEHISTSMAADIQRRARRVSRNG